MPKEINLRKNKVQERKQQVSTYGTQTPLSSTAVERGSTRWLAGSNVQIDGILAVAGTFDVSGVTTISGVLTIAGPTGITGNLTIQGVTDITGQLNVTGPTALDGVTTIGGDTTITGLLAVDGPTTISGTLDIEGETTVAADFEIIAGGIFKAGVTKIEPTGKATFGTVIIDPASPRMIQSPSGWLTANGADSIGLSSSNTSSVNLNGTYADLNYAGTSRVVARAGAIDLSTAKVNISGQLDVTGFTWLRGAGLYFPGIPTTAYPPNLHITSTGQVFRSTWTPPT